MRNRLFLLFSLPVKYSNGNHLKLFYCTLACFMLKTSFSFSQLPFNENYGSTSGWTQVSSGISVSGGKCTYTNAADGTDRRIYKSLGATLSNTSWFAEFEITPTGGNIPAHEVFSLTAGTLNPYGTGPFSPNTQDCIGVFLGVSTQQLSFYSKDGTSWVNDPNPISTPAGSTYYVRLSRLSATEMFLEVFSDPSRTTNIAGSPVCGTIPSTIVGLNTLQHTNGLYGSTSRTLSATLDNTLINNGSSFNSCSQALPIELINFDVNWENEDFSESRVSWQTISELNNDFFEVERSVDGINFETILMVPGAGNSTQTIDYSELDKAPFREGPSYYRLKQTDFDGTHTTSPIEILNIPEGLHFISLYPNPTKDHIRVLFSSVTDENVHVTVTNELGQLVREFDQTVLMGFNSVDLDLHELGAGNYFFGISTTSGLHKIEHKFVKSN